MRHLSHDGLIRTCVVALTAVLSCGVSSSCVRNSESIAPAERPRAEDPRADAPQLAAWILPYADSLKSLERNAAFVTLASPTYFRLAVSGMSAHLEDWDPNAPFPRAKLDTIRASSNFEVIPLVGCIGACGAHISRVLDDDAARRSHVADLLRVAREQKLDGLFIDYEDLDAATGSVTRFVRELSLGLHAEGKKLALVIQEPCGVDLSCRRAPFPFALATLVDDVDHLAVMEYDFSVDGSEPPAPRDWVSRGLARVVAEVGQGPRLRKVMCAIPLYGRITAGLAGDTAVLFSDIQGGRVRGGKLHVDNLTFDPSVLSKSAKLTGGQIPGVLYLEDRETLAARLALASRFRLGGVALWRLGGEDPCTSNEFARYRRMPAIPCNSH